MNEREDISEEDGKQRRAGESARSHLPNQKQKKTKKKMRKREGKEKDAPNEEIRASCRERMERDSSVYHT